VSTTKDLTVYAQFLRNAAPQAFDSFYAVFANYTRQAVENLIYGTNNLQVLQGQAQQCAMILQILEEVKNGGRDRRSKGDAEASVRSE
jgi:hypothetical protein